MAGSTWSILGFTFSRQASVMAVAGALIAVGGVVFTAGGFWANFGANTAAQAALIADLKERQESTTALASATAARVDLQGEALMSLRADLVDAKAAWTQAQTGTANAMGELTRTVGVLIGKLEIIAPTLLAPTAR